ncbi:DinB family protein [Flagellimonas sp.]|uniref:DinB family protein n=1 Tax=Flagellimonas sp. TaxID=2058762 RepID=UPI003F4A39CD
MNRRLLLSVLGLSPLAFLSAKIPMYNPTMEILIKRWKKSEEYSLAVLEAMPAETIEFRPTEEQFSFAQHFLHLGFINVTYFGILVDSKTYKDFYALMEADFLIQPPDAINVFQPDTLQKRDPTENKEIIRNYLTKTYAYVLSSLAKVKDSDLPLGKEKEKPSYLSGHTNLDLIIRGESHTAHHRAQAIAYLRMNGIRPPGYTVNNTF